MPLKQRFISKKNATTYRLVPRCQVDPNGDASERVLVPVSGKKNPKFNINLPECALPTPVTETTELKKRILLEGPQPDWDSDIVATFGEDFDHEGEDVLDDNFVTIANEPVGKSQASDELENYSDFGGESLFSSALSNCTEDVKILNARFEKMCESYEDECIGALDFDHIEGYLSANDESVTGGESHYVEDKKKLFPYECQLEEGLKSKVLVCVQSDEEQEESEDEEEEDKQSQVYDCESIISTYSRTQNLPAVIKMEKKEKPVKIPTNLWKKGVTKSNLKNIERDAKEEDTDSDDESVVSSLIRHKNETPEEKRQRKATQKQIKRENRMVKKENKLAFKEEKKKRQSVALNANRTKVIHL